jgi:NADH-quinone oxidoreductase subunit E
MSHPDAKVPVAVDELPRDGVARFDAELAPILKRYPEDRKAAAMLPALHLAQAIFGFISPAVQRLAADRLGTSAARAEEVATFYVMYHTHPVGRHLVEICTNVSCSLSGGQKIFAYLEKKLGVGGGGTTADGRITLREVECLGSCGTAPAMLLDANEQHERLTVEKVEQILGGLR